MSFYHKSVLLREVLDGLGVSANKTYIDATAGDGGHSIAVAEKGGKVLAIDQDEEALERLRVRLTSLDKSVTSRIIPVGGNFVDIADIAKTHHMDSVDGVLFDLGLSKYQIKSSNRGFSFAEDEYLDMRMNKKMKMTAADIIATMPEDNLAQMLAKYGEEPQAREIAKAICIARRKKPIMTTGQLVDIVEGVYLKPGRVKGKKRFLNPATLVFQAFRIAVNDELLQLKSVLPVSLTILKKGGRLAVISFHSLEDRIVKQFMRSNPNLTVLTKDPIRPNVNEVRLNSSARSAKLRIACYDIS